MSARRIAAAARWANPETRERMLASRRRPIDERLAKFRVVRGENECWGWSGCHNGVGYPVLRVDKRLRVATQLALEADGRPAPSDEHVACHTCDNPICTNPRHLWWGTEKDNMRDASRKGRLSGWSRQRGARKGAAERVTVIA